jgi:hypothetical protein
MVDRFLAAKKAYTLSIDLDDDARKACGLNDEEL